MAREERAHELFRFMALRGPESYNSINPQQEISAALTRSEVVSSIENVIKENPKAEDLKKALLNEISSAEAKGSIMESEELSKTILGQLSKVAKDKRANFKKLSSEFFRLAKEANLSPQDYLNHQTYKTELVQIYDTWLVVALKHYYSSRSDVTEEGLEENLEKSSLEYIRNLEGALRTAKLINHLAHQTPVVGQHGIPDRIMNSPVLMPNKIRNAISFTLRAEKTPEPKSSKESNNVDSPVLGSLSLQNARDQWAKRRQELDQLKVVRERILEAAAKHSIEARELREPRTMNEPDLPGIIGKAWKFIFGQRSKKLSVREPEPPVDARLDKTATRRLFDALDKGDQNFLESRGIQGDKFTSVLGIPGVLNKLEEGECLLGQEANTFLSLVGPTRFVLGSKVTQSAIEEAFRPSQKIRALNAISMPDKAVQVLGFADLVVVRQRLLRYELGEIAHVENVLPKENRERVHTRTRSFEQAFETEVENEEEQERDLQSTERFEMQAEAESTLKEDFKIDFGLNVAASYGTVATGSVNVSTSLGIGYSTSKSETERQATNFAREVVSKAASKVRQRVHTVKRSTVIETIEEQNRHALKGGDKPFSGVYHWIDKVYETELREYGNRFMIEFYVPEPSAYLLKLDYETSNPDLMEPAEFAISAADIGPENYLSLAHQYQAFDVEPPPPLFVNVGYAHRSDSVNLQNSLGDNYSYVAQELELPAGYVPDSAVLSVSGGNYHWSNDNRLLKDLPWVHIGFCGATLCDDLFDTGSSEFVKLNQIIIQEYLHETHKSAPLTIRVSHMEDQVTTVNVNIICKRTCRCYREWQIKTHDTILRQYLRLKTEYEDRVANAGVQGGIQIQGRNPLENRQREMDELKKAAIQLLRNQPFNFDAIDDSGAHPEIIEELADETRRVAQFFEGAFEWNQMTYFFYPYFWGDPDRWNLRNQLQNADPIYCNFLRSGAARVLVPVTPGYERMVMNYIDPPAYLESDSVPESSRLWLDESPTDVTDPGLLFPEAWMELLQVHLPDLISGSGTLNVTQGSDVVTIESSNWQVNDRDVDGSREIFIQGVRYVITEKRSDTEFRIDRNYEGPSQTDARYMLGSVLLGSPWEERVPTSLVILGDEKDKLDTAFN